MQPDSHPSGKVGSGISVMSDAASLADHLDVPDSDVDTLLELNGVSKSFISAGRENQVLRDVSFKLFPNEVLWLQGNSGAGKSSLLRVAALLSSPTSAHVNVKGRRVAGGDAAEVRRSLIGMVFQNGNLIPGLTLQDNIAIASRRPRYQRVDQLLKEFGLGNAARTLGKEASGGQAQRAALCRALLNEPAILLADEPTAGLDSRNSQDVMTFLGALANSGRSVVIASHDERFAEIATRSLRIVRGALV